MNDTEMMALCRGIAIDAHRGQKRRNGDDYFKAHVEAVAIGASVLGTAAVCVAYLHDVLEDGAAEGWTAARLESLGVLTGVVEDVATLTREVWESYPEYIGRVVQGSRRARCVKILDLVENLTDCVGGKNKARREKYELAKLVLETSLEPGR